MLGIDVELAIYPWSGQKKTFDCAVESSNLASPTFDVNLKNPPRMKIFSVRIIPVDYEMGTSSTKDFESVSVEIMESLRNSLNKIVSKCSAQIRGSHLTVGVDMAAVPGVYYDVGNGGGTWKKTTGLAFTNFEAENWMPQPAHESQPFFEKLQGYLTPQDSVVEVLLRQCYRSCSNVLLSSHDALMVDPANVSFKNGTAHLAKCDSKDQRNIIRRVLKLGMCANAGCYTDGCALVWFGAAFELPDEVVYKNATMWWRNGFHMYMDLKASCDEIIEGVMRHGPSYIRNMELPGCNNVPFAHINSPFPSVFVRDAQNPLSIETETKFQKNNSAGVSWYNFARARGWSGNGQGSVANNFESSSRIEETFGGEFSEDFIDPLNYANCSEKQEEEEEAEADGQNNGGGDDDEADELLEDWKLDLTGGGLAVLANGGVTTAADVEAIRSRSIFRSEPFTTAHFRLHHWRI